MNRDLTKSNRYKRLFTFCFMPNCPEPIYAVHHIRPLSKCGKDTYVNFICLCNKHHQKFKMHSKWHDKQTTLLTYKFYREYSVLGFTSDMPEEAFLAKITPYKPDTKEMKIYSKDSQKPLTIETMSKTTLNYGQKKEGSSFNLKLCKMCGHKIKFYSFCSPDCADKYVKAKRYFDIIARQSPVKLAIHSYSVLIDWLSANDLLIKPNPDREYNNHIEIQIEHQSNKSVRKYYRKQHNPSWLVNHIPDKSILHRISNLFRKR